MLRYHPFGEVWTEFAVYFVLVVVLALLACVLTLSTKTVVPSAYRLTTFDENLAAESVPYLADEDDQTDDVNSPRSPGDTVENASPPMIYYSAAGSGVAEVKVILSGFVLHGFLGAKTLVIKSVSTLR